MSENILLRRHAERWAQSKQRPLDGELLETVVGLRQSYDDLAATSWPAGSVEALLLQRWPAHGPLDLPDLETLRDTLDTYWRFLRATGRMASGSAAPADLLKEARRALPKMARACSDRTRFSSGRVLQDFGRSIGISLDGAAGPDELDERLQRITAAWNDLPIAERQRLMPDPTPKSESGKTLTQALNAYLREESSDGDDHDEDEDEVLFQRGDLTVAARQARESAYVQACLALADWVGDGREVTSTGVLRPAVARQAVEELDLITWQRAWRLAVEPPIGGGEPFASEVGELMDRVSIDAWRSAGECIPLDRLWFSCEGADLLDVGSRRARKADRPIGSDTDWLLLGHTLVYGLLQRFGSHRTEPLLAILLSLAVSDDGRIDLADLRTRWRARSPLAPLDPSPDWGATIRRIEDERLNWTLQMFDDTALWVRHGEQLRVSDFGREFTVVLVNAVDAGFLEGDELGSDWIRED